jgi:hypothetical protein
MKKTTFKETEATYEDKLAMIMAVGDATIEEASRALEECGGNIDRALALVYDEAPPPSTDYASSSSSLHNAPYKPSKTAHRMEDVDDELIAKPRESLRHAPTLVARRQPAAAAAAAPKALEENVFHATRQPSTMSPSIASANQNGRTFNQATTKAITPRDSLFHAPGAFAVYGPRDVESGHDDDSFTYTQQTVLVVNNEPIMPTEPVEAHVVDHSEDYVESLEEQLQQERETLRRREEELEHMQRQQENIVVGQVLLGVGNNDDKPNDEEKGTNNENPTGSNNNKYMCGSKQKVVIGVIAVLAIVPIIVGVVVATLSKAVPTQPPATPPTLPPTSATLLDLIELLSLVSPDGGTALATPSTPQNKAVNWLANNINFNKFSDKRKIQRYTLGVLYYSTNGDSWRNNNGWLTDKNECNWWNSADGLFCDENGAIVDLDLYDGSGNNLVGTIPMELALLSDSVAQLSLWDNNNLAGTIPSELGLLSKLTGLALSWNSLMGTTPSQIGLLSNLTALWLSDNSLTGTIPSQLGLLSKLNWLSLWGNSLTGTIPTEIALLSNLDWLDIYDNNFTGEFTCPAFLDSCYISCYDYNNDTCRSL